MTHRTSASVVAAAILAACTLFLPPRAGSAALPASHVGDVDGDGAVTVRDALLALQDSLGLIVLPADQRAVAALGGKKPTAANARSILRAAMGAEALPWVQSGSYVDGPTLLGDGSLVVADYDHETMAQILPDGTASVFVKTPGFPASSRLRADGHLIVSEFSGRVDDVAPDRTLTVIGPPKGQSLGDPYDVLLGPHGSMYVSGQGSGLVFTMAPDGSLTTVIKKGLKGSTGMAIAGDGRLLVADPFDTKIWAFTLDGAGAPTSPGAVWGKVPAGINGVRVDRAGNLWAANLNDGRVYVLDSQGRTIRRFPTSAGRASSLEFGSAGSRTVYITTGNPGGVSLLRLLPGDPLTAGMP